MRKKEELFKVQSGTAFINTTTKISGDKLLSNRCLHKEHEGHEEYQCNKLLDNRFLHKEHEGHEEYQKKYNLPNILKREFEKSFRGEGGRAQSGYFHVWFRGNNRYNVFYTDDDYIGFLSRCNTASARHKSKITAFAIMNNHVHLQVYTNNLSLLITSILISFNRWFNKRKGLRGKLFETPFKSYQLLNQESLRKNMLYIITNPVNAGICDNVYEYKWTSYHFSKGQNLNHLRNIIDLDTTIMDGFYSSPKELLLATKKFIAQRNSYNSESNANNSSSNIAAPKYSSNNASIKYSSSNASIKYSSSNANLKYSSSNANLKYSLDMANHKSSDEMSAPKSSANMANHKSSDEIGDKKIASEINGCSSSSFIGKIKHNDSELAIILKNLLNNKELYDLARGDLAKIVKLLKYEYNATYRQIASLTHESYEDIRRMVLSSDG